MEQTIWENNAPFWSAQQAIVFAERNASAAFVTFTVAHGWVRIFFLNAWWFECLDWPTLDLPRAV